MASPRGPYARQAQIKAYVPEALKEALREYVQGDYGRSESTVVMDALREWLPKHGIVLRLKGSDDVSPKEAETGSEENTSPSSPAESYTYPNIRAKRRWEMPGDLVGAAKAM